MKENLKMEDRQMGGNFENSFYQNKRVLITGHTGFKGTWLVYMLKALGAKVYGYSLSPKEGSLYAVAHPSIDGEYFQDIRDRTSLQKAIDTFDPQIIFHLAAHSSLNQVYDIPYDVFEINMMGTTNLLEIIRQKETSIPVVVITSDKCYQQPGPGRPFQETDPLGVADPYSTSKACQELVAQCYERSFPQMLVATARASNTIGGGDSNKTRLIPYLIGCYSHGKAAQIRNPSFIRPWQYVLDVLWGYLLLGEKLHRNDADNMAYNFGANQVEFKSVGQIADDLAEHFPGATYEIYGTSSVDEAPILRLDNKKAATLLNWVPLYSYYETLEQIAEFYRSNRDLADICQMQVQQYLSRAKEMNRWL